jgi:hypothetical protein
MSWVPRGKNKLSGSAQRRSTRSVLLNSASPSRTSCSRGRHVFSSLQHSHRRHRPSSASSNLLRTPLLRTRRTTLRPCQVVRKSKRSRENSRRGLLGRRLCSSPPLWPPLHLDHTTPDPPDTAHASDPPSTLSIAAYSAFSYAVDPRQPPSSQQQPARRRARFL